MSYKVTKTETEWRELLSEEQYRVTRQQGTERPFTNKYWQTDDAGVYRCVCCNAELFTSDAKFATSCGWPAFDKPADSTIIEEHFDDTHGMRRVEVKCADCGAHLGHVFPDGPTETGVRYCINSVAIDLEPDTTAD